MNKQSSEKLDFDLEASNAFTLKGEDETQIEQSTKLEIETNKSHKKPSDSHSSIRIKNLTNFSFGICEHKFSEENDINEDELDIIGNFKKDKNKISTKERKCDSVVKIKLTKNNKGKIIKVSKKEITNLKTINKDVNICDKELDNLIESTNMNNDEPSEENKMELENEEKKEEKAFNLEESIQEENILSNSENVESDKKIKEDFDTNVSHEEIKDNSSDMIIEQEKDINSNCDKEKDKEKEKETENVINNENNENNVIKEISKMTLENESLNQDEKRNDLIIEINKEKEEKKEEENVKGDNEEEKNKEKEDNTKQKEENEEKEEKENKSLKNMKDDENRIMTNEDINRKEKKEEENKVNQEEKEKKLEENINQIQLYWGEDLNEDIESSKYNNNENIKKDEKEKNKTIEEKEKMNENQDNIINEEKVLNNMVNDVIEEKSKKEDMVNKEDGQKEIKKEEIDFNPNSLKDLYNLLKNNFNTIIEQQVQNAFNKYSQNPNKSGNAENLLNLKEKAEPEDSEKNFLGKKRAKEHSKDSNNSIKSNSNESKKEKEKNIINDNDINKELKVQNDVSNIINNENTSLGNSLEKLIFNCLYEKVMNKSLSDESELEKIILDFIKRNGYSNVKSSLNYVKKEKERKDNIMQPTKNKKELDEYHYHYLNNFHYRYKSLNTKDGIQTYICCDKTCKGLGKLNIKERKFEIIQSHTVSPKVHLAFNDDRPVFFMNSRKLDEVHIKRNENNDKYHLEWFN